MNVPNHRVQWPMRTLDRLRGSPYVLPVSVVLALALRFFRLGAKSLWGDEGATWWIATMDLQSVLAKPDPVHPPGYYALMHFVTRVGDSEWMLRAPSVLASVATLVLTHRALMRLFDTKVASIATVLLLFSPLDFWYAQEARQPAIAAMFVSAGLYAFSRRDRIGYILVALLVPLTLLFEFVAVIGWVILLGILTVRSDISPKGNARNAWTAALIGALVFMPIRGSHFWQGFGYLLNIEGTGVWYGRILGGNPLTGNPAGLLVMAGVSGVILAVIVRFAIRSQRWGSVITVIALLLNAVLIMAPAVDRAYSVKRVIVVVSPIIAATIAVLLAKLPRIRLFTAMGLTLSLALISLVMAIQLPKDDWRSAVAYINEMAGPADVAWVDNVPWLPPGVYKYYSGRPPVFLDADPGPTIEDLQPAARVWLITRRRPQDPIPAIGVEAWFDENSVLLDEYPVHRMAVRSYSLQH